MVVQIILGHEMFLTALATARSRTPEIDRSNTSASQLPSPKRSAFNGQLPTGERSLSDSKVESGKLTAE